MLTTYCKDIVEANGVPTLWKYVLDTTRVPARKKLKALGYNQCYIPIITCIGNIAKYDMASVVSVIEPEQILKLLDDELSTEMQSLLPLLNLLDLLIMYDPSHGTSSVERIQWFQKVPIYICIGDCVVKLWATHRHCIGVSNVNTVAAVDYRLLQC
jgi:hypothetical protein